MSESSKESLTQLSSDDIKARSVGLGAYALMLLGFGAIVPWFFAALLAYKTKAQALSSAFSDHYDHIVSVFFTTVGLLMLGILLTPIKLGYGIIFCTYVWSFYSVTTGFLRLYQKKPYNDL